MRRWLGILLLALALVGHSAADSQDEDDGSDAGDVNGIVDQILAGARAQIVAEGKDQLDLPDITEKFKKKVGPVKVTGKFEARNGYVKSLSSLQRTGEVVLSTDGDKITVDVPLGLSDLNIWYSYKAKLGKLGPGGHLTATVRSNAVNLKASLAITDDACSLGVDSLSLTDLGKIDVHVTGLGQLNFLYSKIVTAVTAKLHDKIAEAVQSAMKNAITKAALSMDCSSLLGL